MSVSRLSWMFALALGITLSSRVANAIVLAPYTADANTLHLWQLDAGGGTGGTTPDSGNGTIAGNTLLNLPAVGNPTLASHSGTLQSAGYGSYLVGGQSGNWFETEDTVTSNALFQGGDGQFTFEAIVRWNSYTGTGGGEFLPFFSISDENGSSPVRPYQVYLYDATTDGGNHIGPELYFSKSTDTTGSTAWNLPTGADPNAVDSTSWYHLAISYDGTTGGLSGEHVKAYWTKIDPSAIVASELTSIVAQAGAGIFATDLATIAANPPDLAIGHSANGTAAGPGVDVDQVRISDTVRLADQFIFAVPEPGSISLTAMGLIALVGSRLRRQN